jgi:hypothetical protein
LQEEHRRKALGSKKERESEITDVVNAIMRTKILLGLHLHPNQRKQPILRNKKNRNTDLHFHSAVWEAGHSGEVKEKEANDD